MRHLSSLRPLVGPLVLVLVGGVAACGGKIAGGDGMNGGSSGASSGSSGASSSGAPSSSSSSPAPTSPSILPDPSSTPPGIPQPSGKPTVEDACDAICKRNGQCGANPDQAECKSSCADEINGAGGCTSEGNAYIQCYAANLDEGCAALPPVCEDAYCAYTRCAGKYVPPYCR